MAITQTISNFPDAPDSGTDTPTEFNAKADAFVNHQSDVYVGEVNTWAGEVNTTQTEINNIVATIPDGVIDDTTPSGTNTYSSNKIENGLSEKVAKSGDTMTGNLEAPTVSIGGNNVDAVNYGVESSMDYEGGYVKFPDGTLICNGIAIITPVANEATGVWVTFPIEFSDLPLMQVSANSTVIGESVKGCSFSGRALDGCDIYAYRTNTTSTQVHWQATGRWK